MGLINRFIPKSVNFYDLLAELSENILDGAEQLKDLMVKWENLSECSSRIHLLEHKCDDITHKIISELNETFITPIDREDIHTLVNSMDNIIDSIDVISNRIHLYKVKKPIEFGPELAEILLRQMKLLTEVVKNFDAQKNSIPKLVAIRNYETEGDSVFQKAISNLFEFETDVVELIKKKEILELMEKAVDRCQTVTIVIESIIIKYA
jgi:uncharacterized protein